MKVSIEWRHRIHATSQAMPGDGLRSLAAWLLRHAADRLDQGQSIRISYSTEPRVQSRLAAECIERGFSHANRLLADMAHQAACEEALKEHHAELFEDPS